MKTLPIVISLTLLISASAQTLDVQLQRAVQKEVATGDLKSAVEEYRNIAARAGSNRTIAAQALMHLAATYEKQGESDARKTYERIVKDYADQPAFVAQARQRLAALGVNANSGAGLSITQFYGHPDRPQITIWNVSADGRYAGATDYATGNAAIVDLASSKSHNVTDYGNWNDAKGFVDQGAISRDGKQIAFWHYMNSAADGQLRIAGADAKNERTLYRSENIDGKFGWGIPTDWSPDGTQVVMQLEHGTTTTQGVTDFVLIPVSGGAPRVLKTAGYNRRYRPRILFSPDGRYIAYDYPPGKDSTQSDIFVLPVTGGPETVVAADPAREQIAGWAPDGSLLFLSDRTGSTCLYRVAMKDGRQAGQPDLVRAAFPGTPLGISKSGGLYYSQSVTQSNAFIAALDFSTGKMLSAPERVSDHFANSARLAVWSPDGRQLSYAVPRGGSLTFAIRQDSSRDEREIPNPAGPLNRLGGLGWNSDGQTLLVRGTRADTDGIFRVDTVTGTVSLAWNSAGTKLPNHVDWSGDGKWVFYRDSDPRSIVRQDTTTGEKKTIYTAESETAFYRVSPNARRLAFVQQAAKPFLAVISTDGGPATPVFRDDATGFRFPSTRGGIVWSLDGRYLLFVRQTDDHEELWVVPADGGEARKTDLSFTGSLAFLNVHPDGKRIAYTLDQPGDEYWVMDNFPLPAK